MKTLLILEVGNKQKMPYEFGTEDENGEYTPTQNGALSGENNLEELETLQEQADEVWACDSLVSRRNMRKN